ncbi:MAG TPA: hypothetical protein ENF49_00270 [Candidatus Altiarchaeales archaeon]|nr:hypothetical protein [Candidatus Altiarchaeales archaeon]HEX54553.1 hypothetical protein [Candidatus Altiarchaeales archaeon]
MIEKIKKIIKGLAKGYTPSEVIVTPRELELAKVREEKLREIGRLKGEVSIWKRRYMKERERRETLEKMLKEETLAERVERERRKLREIRKEDIIFLDEIPRDVIVADKFHRKLGYFYGFFVDKRTGLLGIALTEKPKSTKPFTSRAWLFSSLREMIHHSENLGHMIDAKYIPLNITWEGFYVPDIDAMVPAKDIIID